MVSNKYDEFFFKKSVVELIEKLFNYKKSSGATMEKDWYDAMLSHLSIREMPESQKELIKRIISNDPEIMQEKSIKNLIFGFEVPRVQVTNNEENIKNLSSLTTSFTEYEYASQLISLQLTQSEVNSGAASQKVNNQLTQVMDSFMNKGYEFYCQITLPTIVAPGCLASLFGAKSTTIDLPVLVFRKLKHK